MHAGERQLCWDKVGWTSMHKYQSLICTVLWYSCLVEINDPGSQGDRSDRIKKRKLMAGSAPDPHNIGTPICNPPIGSSSTINKPPPSPKPHYHPPPPIATHFRKHNTSTSLPFTTSAAWPHPPSPQTSTSPATPASAPSSLNSAPSTPTRAKPKRSSTRLR